MTGVDSPSKMSREEFSKIMVNKDKCEMFPHIESIGTDLTYKHEIVWKNVFGFLVMHILAAYGMLLFFMGTYRINTVLWSKYNPEQDNF